MVPGIMYPKHVHYFILGMLYELYNTIPNTKCACNLRLTSKVVFLKLEVWHFYELAKTWPAMEKTHWSSP
jgi:hypothetical protein